MIDTITLKQPAGEAIGPLLARARRARRISQMELAAEAGVSTRHLSFVETGRARPGRELVMRLAEALRLPARQADALLLAAGFAPAHRETPLEAPALVQVIGALRLMLERHDPLPAAAFDARWDLVMTNVAHSAAVNACLLAGTDEASGPVQPLTLLPAPRPNLLRLLCHPNGARRFIANWAEVTRAMLERICREPPADPAHSPPLEEVMAYPGIAPLLRRRDSAPPALVLPVEIRAPDGSITRYLTTLATLGTAQDLTLRELRIETYHPA